MMAQLPEYAAAGGWAIDVLDAEGFEEGSVGWAAANCSASLGGQPDFPLRVSVVVRLEGGHWHVVQMHCSVGVANEEMVGIELTTTLEAVADAVRTDRPQLGVSAAPDGTITVLFTDIEDSTKLAEQLGDERWMELLRWHRDDVQKAASRHRGYVVKSLGDGFMIAFASASEGEVPPPFRLTGVFDGLALVVELGVQRSASFCTSRAMASRA
jgi:hypothetical protein